MKGCRTLFWHTKISHVFFVHQKFPKNCLFLLESVSSLFFSYLLPSVFGFVNLKAYNCNVRLTSSSSLFIYFLFPLTTSVPLPLPPRLWSVDPSFEFSLTSDLTYILWTSYKRFLTILSFSHSLPLLCLVTCERFISSQIFIIRVKVNKISTSVSCLSPKIFQFLRYPSYSSSPSFLFFFPVLVCLPSSSSIEPPAKNFHCSCYHTDALRRMFKSLSSSVVCIPNPKIFWNQSMAFTFRTADDGPNLPNPNVMWGIYQKISVSSSKIIPSQRTRL